MTFTLPKHAAVAIAGGAGAILVGAAVVLLPNLHRADPATILPDNTMALIRHADRDVLETLNRHIEGFEGIPLPDYPVDVALLPLPDGNTAWVMFDTTTAPAGTRFAISASDETVRSQIGLGEARLSDDSDYASLTGFLNDAAPSAYMRFPGIRMKNPSLLEPQESLGVMFEQDRLRVVLPDTTDPLPALFSLLSPSAQSLLQSKARTLLTSVAGSDISPTYDILPLLGMPAMLDMKGGNALTLAGTTRDTVAARTLAEKLHAGFAGLQAGAEVVNRELDDQFSYTGIRKADSSVEQTSERINGFDVQRSIRTGGSSVFLTALRGGSMALSNDEAGFETAVNASSSGTLLSGGTIRLSADAAAVRSIFPFLADRAADIRWTVMRMGNRLVLEIPR